MKIKFIKLLDERIANILNDGGFSYIEEKINGNQRLFCFEESPELVEAIRDFCGRQNYQNTVIVIQDDSLFF